jgi:hypothetical protein
MDKIRVKLANPYLENFAGISQGFTYDTITFDSRPIQFLPIYAEQINAEKCALYAVKREDGKYSPFGVVFLLAQMTEIEELYTKTITKQASDGEVSGGWEKLTDQVVNKPNNSTPLVDKNRYSKSLQKSANSINNLLNRGVDLNLDYKYELGWDDFMSTQTITKSTFVSGDFGGPSDGKVLLTTPNEKYEALSNWAGTSYNAFWCVLTGDPMETEEEVYNYLVKAVDSCVAEQDKAADGPAEEEKKKGK